jgi:phosphotransacetylase/acyl dehydratase
MRHTRQIWPDRHRHEADQSALQHAWLFITHHHEGAPDMTDQPPLLTNRLFNEIAVGDTASLTHTVSQRDIDLFAEASGDVNPAHVDPEYAAGDMFHHIIIHGMWGASLISAVLGTRLPGPGTIYLGQDLRFRRPVTIGDTITATVTVREMKPDHQDLILDCICTNQAGVAVITGAATVRAPSERVTRPVTALPAIRVGRHDGLQRLITLAQGGAAVTTAVVFPVDTHSLQAALTARDAGLIVPVLIGPQTLLSGLAARIGADLTGLRRIEAATESEAASCAVALARGHEVGLLMKGDLHTEALMHPVVASATGLRTARQISHVYVLDVPATPRLLLMTDGAVNIAPTLAEKAAITQNAIDLAHLLGIAEPKVAILAAVEMINPRLQATLDAAALCKMADRGQIKGALLDGPLAFDNAVSVAAAEEKGIVSKVAGRADILVVPDLEAGNMIAKSLLYLAGAEAAGVVMGATVPIILSSRADSPGTRLASCAVAVLAARGVVQ